MKGGRGGGEVVTFKHNYEMFVHDEGQYTTQTDDRDGTWRQQRMLKALSNHCNWCGLCPVT